MLSSSVPVAAALPVPTVTPTEQGRRRIDALVEADEVNT
jgi:hypothetical protein